MTMRTLTSVLTAFAMAGWAVLTSPTPARADAVADFYKDKRITMLVSAAPGPAYDLFGRLLAGHMGKHIPGKPGFIVRNMPGAGGMVALNYAYTQGARDGTLIFTLHIALPLQQALGRKGVRFDAGKIIGLGRLSAGNTVTGAWHTTGIKNYKDLYEKELLVGGGQLTSNTAMFPVVAHNLFGMKLKVIAGYKSLSEQMLAMERGEIRGLGSISLVTLQNWKAEYLKKKQFVPLFQWGLRREKELADIPTVAELAQNPVDKKAVEVLASQMDLGRSFFMPPEVPRDRVAALRHAFDRTVKDPDFLAEAKKSNSDIIYASGTEVEQLVATVLGAPKEAIARLKDAMVQRAGGRCEDYSGAKSCAKKKKKKKS
ncbi:MAG: Bug family tripartite tricarboxylate transporter substrate binding protein [Alphaproteobacteria bacterium]